MTELLLLCCFAFYGCAAATISSKNQTTQPEAAASAESTAVTAIEDAKQTTCKDKNLLPIWREIQKDADVKEMIIDANLGGDCSDYIKIAKQSDLNHDGIKEIFVEGKGTFGSVSTIPIWILEKKKEYNVILREQGEFYQIEKNRTNSYQDVYFNSRRDITSSFLRTYKFDKKDYKVAKCQIEIYSSPKNIRKLFDCTDEKSADKFQMEVTQKP